MHHSQTNKETLLREPVLLDSALQDMRTKRFLQVLKLKKNLHGRNPQTFVIDEVSRQGVKVIDQILKFASHILKTSMRTTKHFIFFPFFTLALLLRFAGLMKKLIERTTLQHSASNRGVGNAGKTKQPFWTKRANRMVAAKLQCTRLPSFTEI